MRIPEGLIDKFAAEYLLFRSRLPSIERAMKQRDLQRCHSNRDQIAAFLARWQNVPPRSEFAGILADLRELRDALHLFIEKHYWRQLFEVYRYRLSVSLCHWILQLDAAEILNLFRKVPH